MYMMRPIEINEEEKIELSIGFCQRLSIGF